MDMLNGSAGLFDPNSNLLTDITLIVQILFFLLLSAGVVAQLQNKYKLHAWLQTPVVILNIVFIVLVMLPVFRNNSVEFSNNIGQPDVVVTIIHAALGIVAQVLSIYCLLAGLNILPKKIGSLRYWMWLTYTAWTAAVVFGISVYILYYPLK